MRGYEKVTETSVALITSLCHHPQSNFLSCLTAPFDALTDNVSIIWLTRRILALFR